jgi:hypothetical protein
VLEASQSLVSKDARHGDSFVLRDKVLSQISRKIKAFERYFAQGS